MTGELERRLAELRAEWEDGRRMLTELEARQAGLRDSLLRISGAIQVLEELLQEPRTATDAADAARRP